MSIKQIIAACAFHQFAHRFCSKGSASAAVTLFRSACIQIALSMYWKPNPASVRSKTRHRHQAGFEPATRGLLAHCYTKLSYRNIAVGAFIKFAAGWESNPRHWDFTSPILPTELPKLHRTRRVFRHMPGISPGGILLKWQVLLKEPICRKHIAVCVFVSLEYARFPWKSWKKSCELDKLFFTLSFYWDFIYVKMKLI